MRDRLLAVLDTVSADYLELRSHVRHMTRIRVMAGEMEDANFTDYSGVGVRALVDGAWGFSSTGRRDAASLRRAAQDAARAARVAATRKSERVGRLAEAEMGRGTFETRGREPLEDRSLEEKLEMVTDVEHRVRETEGIRSAMAFYREFVDEKVIVNTDGAEVELREDRPDFYVQAVAGEGSDMVTALEAEGVTGGWAELFAQRTPQAMGERAAARAKALLEAPFPKGERATVVLDPSLVGLISHEAFGHTVEADFIQAGSAAAGRLGERVASELVTLVDSGQPHHDGHPAGTLPVDDEGVVTRDAVIIDRGILRSYLFDRQTAAAFEFEPTGNARAFEYSDEPLIRMRNTYIEPGDRTREELLEDVSHGYLLEGAGPGQADSSAEFMFGVQEARRIEDGEVGELLRGVTISGNAFEVLRSVDGVGHDFAFHMGWGFCGKHQLAKVDGGGGSVRCQAIVGGRQEAQP